MVWWTHTGARMLRVLTCPRRRSGRQIARTAILVVSVCFFASHGEAQDAPEKPVELPQIDVVAPGTSKAVVKAPKVTPSTSSPESAATAASATLSAPYNPSLDFRDLKLPPGTQLTTAGPVEGYRALTAMSASKTATPIGELPQSIQVIPKELLRDQGSLGIGEALQNVSGVQGTMRLQPPAYDATLIRGFIAEQWVDGLPVYFNTGFRDALANVERIEVLKGPNAILYGGGNGAPVGGAVNIISKLPTGEAKGEVGLKFGSNSYLRPTFDIDQPISKDGTVLFRVTGEYLAADSFVEVLETDAYAINPTLAFTNKTDTTLLLQGSVSRWKQQDYQGLPATGTVAGDFRIDRDLFIGPSDIPDSAVERRSVTATLDHRFDKTFSGSVKARWSSAEIAERPQIAVGSDGIAGNTPLFAPSSWALANALIDQQHEEFTIASHLSARFDAGPSRNTVLVGADYSRLTDSGFIATDLFLGGAGVVDLANPSFPSRYVEPPLTPATSFADAEKAYVTQGLYVQWQSTLYDRLHVLGSLRLADLDIDTLEHQEGTRENAHVTKLLPRVGGVLDVWGGISVYASYGEGLKGHPIITHKGAPDPEESAEWEAGFKLDIANSLSGTIAVFEIERTNVPLLSNFVAVGVSEDRSRGFETDLLWQPDDCWQILASFALIDAVHVTAGEIAPAGSKVTGVPERSGRLWVNYRFDADLLRGWSVGGGIYAASQAPVDFKNLYFTDSYFTIDAKIGYDSNTFSAGLTLKNLTGEDYFLPYNYASGRVAAGEERAAYASIAWKY